MKTIYASGCAGLLCACVLLSASVGARGAGAPGKGAYTVLSEEDLGKLLDQMVYAPKKLKKGYLVEITRDTWTVNIQLVLSADGTKLGMNSNLGVIENAAEVTREQWMGLLTTNGKIDPSFFYFDDDAKKLFLHRTLDNRAIDAEMMRKQIDTFCGNVIATGDVWKFTK